MRYRALVLVDGEHYPDVTREALDCLPYEVVAAVLVGGTEKLRDELELGVPLYGRLEEALGCVPQVDLVFDLSDEPVLSPPDRMRLAALALARGLAYEGPGFRFEPPLLAAADVPTLAVIGTGKRIGKTAVTAHAAALAARDRRVVIVAMGRGGPAEPEVIERRPSTDDLLALSRTGRHAASDHLEIAALTGLPTVGCRRAGGGLAGEVARSNVLEGMARAAALAPELVLLDGSGAAMPPVAADRRILVVGAHQEPAVVAGYLNQYRALLADLVIVTMAEPEAGRRVADAVQTVTPAGIPLLEVTLRPRPLAAIEGAVVAYFATAPEPAHRRLSEHLVRCHGAAEVSVSGSLGDRAALDGELDRLECDVVLVELKGAAVDVVVEQAVRRGLRVVVAANELVTIGADGGLDEHLRRLGDEAVAAHGVPVG